MKVGYTIKGGKDCLKTPEIQHRKNSTEASLTYYSSQHSRVCVLSLTHTYLHTVSSS